MREIQPKSASGEPTRTDASPPVAAKSGKDALRGASYSEGEAQLAPGGALDQAKSPRGSGMLITSSQSNELTYSAPNSLNKTLGADLSETDRPIDDLIGEAVAKPVDIPKKNWSNHPAFAQIGASAAHVFGTGTNKRGVGVTNNGYAGLGRRPTYQSTFPLLNGLDARGFDIDRQMDLNASAMREAYGSLAASVQPGDEVVMTFGGHGSTEGLVGVDSTHDVADILPHADFNGLVQRAVDGGAHVRAIVFACHSGEGAEQMRTTEADRMLRSGKADLAWLSIYQDLRYDRASIKRFASDLSEHEDMVLDKARAELAKRNGGGSGDSVFAATRAQVRAESKRAIEAFWETLRVMLEKVAAKIAAKDGKPPSPIPTTVDVSMQEMETSHDYTLGAHLDCLDDLENRALALAGGPSGLA